MIYLFSSSPATIEGYLKDKEIAHMVISKEEFSDFLAKEHDFSQDDLGITYDFGKIIPKALLSKLPMINIHFSLLPKYRGAVPVEAAILNGEEKTGITIQWMASQMDVGDIILEKEYIIGDQMSAKELQSFLDMQLPSVLEELFSNITEDWPHKTQEGGATYCYKTLLDRRNAQIHFGQLTARQAVQRVRAFNPEPYAWCSIIFQGEQTTMNILRAEEYMFHNPPEKVLQPNEIQWVRGRGLVIGSLQGAVLIIEMVISGKKVIKNGEIVSLKGKLTDICE